MLLSDYLNELISKEKELTKELNTALKELEANEKSFHTINIEREFKTVFIHNK